MKFNLRPAQLRNSLMITLVSLFAANSYAANCQFDISNQWGNGFTASVTIANDTSETINGWSVTLEFPDGATMGNPWNGSLTSTSPYTVVNASYNSHIPPGEVKSFGFNGDKAVTGVDVVPPNLGGICAFSQGADLPQADIRVTADQGTLPLPVTFTVENTTDYGEGAIYQWRFGDGQTASGATVEHTYNSAGNHRATLTITDGENQITGHQDILVSEPEPEDAICQFSVNNEWNSGFTGAVTITNDGEYTIRDWQVDLLFPDATSVSGSWNSSYSGNNPYQFINASYNANIEPGGSVEFGFNAQKASAGSDVAIPALSGICRNMQLNSAPVAQITANNTQGTAPFRAILSASGSSDPDGDNLTYRWLLDGKLISQSESLEYIFEEPGNYLVALEVNDGQLSSATAQIDIVVEQEDQQNNHASWILSSEKSSLYFVSVKKTHLMEVHSFDAIEGSIDKDGNAQLSIALDSVNTGIVLRNERMREHLFETQLYPDATVSLQVASDFIESLEQGRTETLEISPILELHGLSLPVTAKVRITKLGDTSLLIKSAEPVVLNATEFGLESGVATLMSLASLDMISLAIPVNFTLLFEQL